MLTGPLRCPRSRRERGRSPAGGPCWGSARLPPRPSGARADVRPCRRRGDGPGAVLRTGQDVEGQRYGGEFRHPVRLGAQLTPRGDELGRTVAHPAAAQILAVVEPRVHGVHGIEIAGAGLGIVHGLDGLPDVGHGHHGERVPQQLRALLLRLGDLGGARGDEGQREERGVVQDHGGPGDLPAERVPDEMHGGADGRRLREHVLRQLGLGVSRFVVPGTRRLELPAPVHGDGTVPARGQRFVHPDVVLLAAGEPGQQQNGPLRLGADIHGGIDDGELTTRGTQGVRTGAGGRGEGRRPAHVPRLSGEPAGVVGGSGGRGWRAGVA